MYNSSQVSKLVDKYYELDGNVAIIEEGCVLEYGLAICFAKGYKTCIIKEVPLTCWTSAYKVRFYNKCPKKYEKMLINF